MEICEATTLVNATFEDMGSIHNDLVRGLEEDAKTTSECMDQIREDGNNNHWDLQSVQKKVQVMETHVGDLEALVRQQEQALNAMESKLCKCGGLRLAEPLKDLQCTPVSVLLSLSYATPLIVPIAIPEVEVVPESPEPLPVCEPAGVIGEGVPVVVASPASERLILGVRRMHIHKQAEPYPCMALGSQRERDLCDARFRHVANDPGRETGGSDCDEWSTAGLILARDHNLLARFDPRPPLCAMRGAGVLVDCVIQGRLIKRNSDFAIDDWSLELEVSLSEDEGCVILGSLWSDVFRDSEEE